MPACPSSLHWLKSIWALHFLHVWGRSNSSEKISFFSPHSGHAQINDLRSLKFVKPGQCCGVDGIFTPPFCIIAINHPWFLCCCTRMILIKLIKNKPVKPVFQYANTCITQYFNHYRAAVKNYHDQYSCLLRKYTGFHPLLYKQGYPIMDAIHLYCDLKKKMQRRP